MKERPIIFSGPMVQAILDGRKTMTRRVVKDPFLLPCLTSECWHDKQSQCDAKNISKCPYGQPGDRLWLREAFADTRYPDATNCIVYRADHQASRYYVLRDGLHTTKMCGDWATFDVDASQRWRPSIHMPRWASRITLEVTDVRVERVQEISEADAIAEGSQCPGFPASVSNRGAFAKLWDSINAKRGYGWDSNPWVWCVSFRRVEP